jgi:hypothetical protein
MSRSRAEGIIGDLVKAGEIQRDQAQDRVEELVDRSRRNTEALVEIVRKEVRKQLADVATKADIQRLQSRLATLTGVGGRGNGGSAAKPSAPAPASAQTAPAKKSAPAKKAAAPAKKAASTGAAATKKAAPAKATPAKKSPAKKATGAKKA